MWWAEFGRREEIARDLPTLTYRYSGVYEIHDIAPLSSC